MKSLKVLGSVALTALLSTSALSAEDKTYAGANLGYGYAGAGVMATYGSTLESVAENFGWEADAYYMFGDEQTFFGSTWNYYGYGVNAYATYTHKFNNKFEALVGLGLGYNHLGYDIDYVDNTFLSDINIDATGLIAFKAQLKYTLDDSMKIVVGSNGFMANLGVEIPFSF